MSLANFIVSYAHFQDMKRRYGSNTTNFKYPFRDLRVHLWRLIDSKTVQPNPKDEDYDLVTYCLAILNNDYAIPTTRPDFLPLRNHMPRSYHSPFDCEATLSARLDPTVFLDLERAMRYLKWAWDNGQLTNLNQLPPGALEGFSILYPDVGANGFCDAAEDDDRPHRGSHFTPDRCALETSDVFDGINRCPGDVKCSWKFQADWRTAASGSPQRDEYNKVLSQLRFYMKNFGGSYPVNSRGVSARYGHIITDEEVVLVRHRIVGEGKYKMYQLEATEGFKLDDPPDVCNGMSALLLIHMLAGWKPHYVSLLV